MMRLGGPLPGKPATPGAYDSGEHDNYGAGKVARLKDIMTAPARSKRLDNGPTIDEIVREARKGGVEPKHIRNWLLSIGINPATVGR